MPLLALLDKLDDEDKSFVWAKRQLDWDIGQQIVALNYQGHYNRKEYKASTPRVNRQLILLVLPTWKTMARKAWSWRSTRIWR